jgi:hypothetical protein
MAQRKKLTRDEFLALIVMTVTLGSLALAIIDPSTRPSFADLAKITISAYLRFIGVEMSSSP